MKESILKRITKLTRSKVMFSQGGEALLECGHTVYTWTMRQKTAHCHRCAAAPPIQTVLPPEPEPEKEEQHESFNFQ